MEALAVVEDFDEIEEFNLGLLAGVKGGAIDQFPFQGAPEAFHGGIVIAVARPAHGRHHACLLQGLPESTAGVGATPI